MTDIYVLSVREDWEGNFGDIESALIFHSAHKSMESAKKAAELAGCSDFEYDCEIKRVRIRHDN